MKKTKVSLRVVGVVISVIIFCSVFATSAVLTYFVKNETHIYSHGLKIEWDNQLAEDLNIDNTIHLNASEIKTFPHTIKYNGTSEGISNVTVNFTWSDVPEGITAEIIYLGNPITQLVLEKGILYNIDTRYTADLLLKSGEYYANLKISYSSYCKVDHNFDSNTTVSIKSDNVYSIGETFDVTVWCKPTQPIKAFEFMIEYDPTILQANSVTEGNIFSGYTTFFNPGIINNTAGKIINIYNLIIGLFNITESGSFVDISFTAIDTGTSYLDLYKVGVTNETQYIPISVKDDYIIIN